MQFNSIQNLKDYADITNIKINEKALKLLDVEYIKKSPVGLSQYIKVGNFYVTLSKDRYKKGAPLTINLDDKNAYTFNRYPTSSKMSAGVFKYNNMLSFFTNKLSDEQIEVLSIVGDPANMSSSKIYTTFEDYKKELLRPGRKVDLRYVNDKKKLCKSLLGWDLKDSEVNLGSLPKFNRLYVGKISKVETLKNDNRIILALEHNQRGYYGSGGSMVLKTIEPGTLEYDYADVGNLYIINVSYGQNAKIYFDQDVKDLPSNEEVLGSFKRDTVVTKQVLEHELKRYNRRQSSSQKKEEVKKLLKTKITDKIDDSNNNPFVLNDVTYFKNKAEYQGQILESDLIDSKITLKHLTRFQEVAEINFDVYYDTFMKELSTNIQHSAKSSTTIGDLKLKLKHVSNVSSTGVERKIYYINDIRINKEEISDVLERASCYINIDEYNNFLKTVSDCSLRIHEYMNKGLITKNLYDDMNRTKLNIRLDIVRKDKRNHIILNKKIYKIKNINKLERVKSQSLLSEFISTVLDEDVVEGFGVKEGKLLLAEGQKAYLAAIEKSKKLLEETIKVLKVEEKTVKTKKGNKKAFVVSSTSNKQYAVIDNIGDAHCSRCEVYSYPSMNYICIVDKDPSNQVGVDKIVNRLYALRNDQLLASKIRTLTI